jgi:hypothetical protein
MADTCPTVRVKAANDQGFMVINEDDFDASVHSLHEDGDEPALEGPAKIPADWQALHWATRVKLAKVLGHEVDKAEDADAAIALEVERRAAEAAQ